MANERLMANARAFQERNDIETGDPKAALEAWEIFDGPAGRKRPCLYFSIEMETGTSASYRGVAPPK